MRSVKHGRRRRMRKQINSKNLILAKKKAAKRRQSLNKTFWFVLYAVSPKTILKNFHRI